MLVRTEKDHRTVKGDINTVMRGLNLGVKPQKQNVSFSERLTCVKYFDSRQPPCCLYEYEGREAICELRLVNFTLGPIIQNLYAHSSFVRGTVLLQCHFDDTPATAVLINYTLDGGITWTDHVVSKSPSNGGTLDFFVPWILPITENIYNATFEFSFIMRHPMKEFRIDNNGSNFILTIKGTREMYYSHSDDSDTSLQ